MASSGDPPRLDLLQGTLDLLILKTLTWGPAHGYAIVKWIQQLTADALQISEGSLYPALHRLDDAGVATILVQEPPQSEDWLAVRDRLSRAAAR